MTNSRTRVYEPYTWKPEYEGLPHTYGGFGIIPGQTERCPAVLIKQRNGQGSSPYLWDLPGGGTNDATDPDLKGTAIREVYEEVRLECLSLAAIGEPLYLPIKKENVLVRVDCAQAFLMEQARGTSPQVTEEALAIAFVHERSFAGFNVVSRKADPASPVFGRTPVMIFDGLSVLKKPFWVGQLTDELRNMLIGDPTSDDFLLMDGGAYLARTINLKGQSDQVSIYRRLNPDQPGGYFRGALEDLV